MKFLHDVFGGGGTLGTESGFSRGCAEQKTCYNSDMGDHYYMKKFGFTLAEVLITLGIIGIVAAMTMPTLIANHQKKQTVVQLRKVYSDLSNAVKLSEVDNGSMNDWDYPSDDSTPFLQRYWLPYLKDSKLVEKDILNKQGYFMLSDGGVNEHSIISHYILLNNGVILSFAFANQYNYIWLFADLNGMKGPNKVGRDIFVFDAYKAITGKYGIKLWGAGNKSNDYYDAEALRNNGAYACNAENTEKWRKFNCGRLIELSNWKIPDNYPW